MAEEQFCREGLSKPVGTVLLTSLESQIAVMVLEQIIVGNDVSSYVEEAQVVLDSIRHQLEQ